MLASRPRIQGSPPFKRLSWTEMQARRDKVCHNCYKKFGPGYQCKTQQVFILEMIVDTNEFTEVEEAGKEEDESNPKPKISLHALSVIATPKLCK